MASDEQTIPSNLLEGWIMTKLMWLDYKDDPKVRRRLGFVPPVRLTEEEFESLEPQTLKKTFESLMKDGHASLVIIRGGPVIRYPKVKQRSDYEIG